MNRRGFTFIELIISLSITSVIGLAVVTLMGAVTSGITSKEDGRQSSIRFSTLKTKMSAYVSPARCILDTSPSSATLWMNDSRESNTVHATEIRWIEFNPTLEQLEVSFVSFPEHWSEEMKSSNDTECNEHTNYAQLLSNFNAKGYITSLTLVDQISGCDFWFNETQPTDITLISFEFKLNSTMGETDSLVIDEVIRQHLLPLEEIE
ncbi:MAG: hypothetical protein CMJ38_02205 [Phycisphaerae bacterium]|nr:hypothetical protein [Phycisphaerae bacterium]